MGNDSIFKTFAVALGLCVVCSVIVSSTATLLKGKQEENKLLDKQINVLKAAGLVELNDSPNAAKTKELFAKVEPVVVKLSTGKVTADVDVTRFVHQFDLLDKNADIAGIKRCPTEEIVYLVKDSENKLQTVVLPIAGRGLWSTMKGFLALKNDLLTVANLTFYDHGETPGLGGEISNPNWASKWSSKTAMDVQGKPVIRVIKGNVSADDPKAVQEVDGISGATLTCNGVNNTVRFWLGENGYGKFLEQLRSEK